MSMDEMDMQGMDYGMENDGMMEEYDDQMGQDQYGEEHEMDMGDGQMMEMDNYE